MPLPVYQGLRRWLWTSGALVATAVVLLLAGCTQSSRPADPSLARPSSPSTTAPAARSAPANPQALRAAVTAQAIRQHLIALQRIADQHGGNRATGTPGYDAAVAYVADQLRASGYRPELQRFQLQESSQSAGSSATNLVAELPGVRGDRVVMIGAHLDSVPTGPGMNDNASGSAMVLELAEQLADARLPATVRFAWWDGEEPGKLGSSHYVSTLPPAERERILLYLNLDMVGSRNFTRLVYAGDGDQAPPGSEVIEQTLTDYFRAQGMAVGSLEPGDGSDHAAFAAAGIPVGGLFAGVRPVSQGEQGHHGGMVDAAATDPCYHQACDDLRNIDVVALEQMADAAAHAVMRFAMNPTAMERRHSG